MTDTELFGVNIIEEMSIFTENSTLTIFYLTPYSR